MKLLDNTTYMIWWRIPWLRHTTRINHHDKNGLFSDDFEINKDLSPWFKTCIRFRQKKVYTSDWFYDCPPPPKPVISFNERSIINHHQSSSWLLDTRKDTIENKVYPYLFLLCAKDYRSLTSGRVSRDTHRISGDTIGSWFWNRRFRKAKLGGALP